MKKTILALPLILCLVLCVFAFSSCGKKGASVTTAEEQTAAATTAEITTAAPEETTAQPTTQGHVHTPEDTITVLLPPTCSNPGIEAYLCVECGAPIDDTYEEIPIDPEAHVVEVWNVTEEVSLLHPTGSRSGVCTECHGNVVQETAFTPTVYDRSDDASVNVFPLSAYLTADVLKDDHFYPTDQNPNGKDFVFEMAILWNETMLNCATDECEICLNRGGSNDPLYTFVPVNNGSGWCKFAGGFDFSSRTKTVLFGPASGDSQPKENYVFIGEYGWHKFAVRLHEEAVISGGAVKYKVISYLYIDGVLAWQLELKDTLAKSKNLLFYAEIDENDASKLVYSDPDSNVSFRFRSDGIADSIVPMCFVIGDVVWKAVPADWTPDIEPVSDPTPATFALSDDLTVPASIFFREKTN